jgi:hypothetical protein
MRFGFGFEFVGVYTSHCTCLFHKRCFSRTSRSDVSLPLVEPGGLNSTVKSEIAHIFGRPALAGGVLAGPNDESALVSAKTVTRLRTDAAIELVGTRSWFAGRATCLRYLQHVLGSRGHWRVLATGANGQPAAAGYQRTGDRTYEAWGRAVLTVTNAGIARILVFAGADLVSRSGLPSTLLAD